MQKVRSWSRPPIWTIVACMLFLCYAAPGAASEAQAGDVYTVRAGDTLSKIAKAVYGDEKKFNLILEANQDQIQDAAVIIPGQQLKIPKAAADTAAWQFHTFVDTAFVAQYAKVPQPEGVLIVDSRPYKPKYVKGHIPTAVSIPFSAFDKHLDQLPQNKSDILIFYCGGPT